MEEAIERVIAHLEQKVRIANIEADDAVVEGSPFREGLHQGRAIAFGHAVHQLKAVIAEHE